MTAARARDLALDTVPVVVGAAATALAAQVSVHAWPVPFTLQTFTVMLCGLLLGARRGAAAQATYLLAGAAGMPVFAELKAGPFWIFPTGGYLMAFVLVAAVAGGAGERWRGGRLGLSLVGTTLLLLGLGSLWLALFVGKAAWTPGFAMVLPSTLVQAGAAWAVARAIRR